MSKEIEVRLYHPGEEKDIVELLRIAFDTYRKLKNPLEYWKWKFQDTPMGSTIKVAIVDNKIIGVGHGLLFNVKIGEEIFSAIIMLISLRIPTIGAWGYTRESLR